MEIEHQMMSETDIYDGTETIRHVIVEVEENTSMKKIKTEEQPEYKSAMVKKRKQKCTFATERSQEQEMGKAQDNVYQLSDLIKPLNAASLLYLLFPVFCSMQVFGLFHGNKTILKKMSKTDDPKEEESRYQPKKRAWYYCYINGKSYSMVAVMLLIIECSRYFPAFFVGSPFKIENHIGRVIQVVWTFQCLGIATIMFRCFHKGKLMKTILNYFDTLDDDSLKKTILILNENNLKRMIATSLAVSWIFFCLNMSLIGLGFFGPIKQINNGMEVLCNPFPYVLYVKIPIFILHCLDAGTAFFSMSFYINISYILSKLFENITNVLIKEVQKSREVSAYPQNLIHIHREHQDVCRLVEIVDRDLKHLTAFFYIANIPLLCFNLYQLITTKQDAISVLVLTSWMATNFSIVLAVSLSAAVLHEKAHGPLQYLYNINVGNASLENGMQLELFLFKLSGTPIGLSACGLFVVTKEIMLTCGGLFLTYFLVLLQFHKA